MTIPKARLRDRHVAARRRQSGFGLLEAIIGMVMVALLIGAGATGIRTLQSTSSGANQTARLDALLVGASEALKKTPYQECAMPASGSDPGDYGAAIGDLEESSAVDQRLIQATDSGTPTIRIVTVKVDGCETAAGDSGLQTISIEAGMNGKSRIAAVTKTNPSKRLHLPAAAIDAPILPPPSVDSRLQSKAGDTRTIYALTATDSTAEQGLLSFEWDCGIEAEPYPAVDPIKTAPDDPMYCQYQSGVTDRTVTDVKLTVTDNANQTDSTTTSLFIPMSTDPRLPPIVDIVSPTPSARTGTASFTVQFSATAIAQDGNIDSVAWDFGDDSTEDNTASTLTATHTYDVAKPSYTVRFTAVADGDLVTSETISIVVNTSSNPPPVARLGELEEYYYAPSEIQFDSSGSTPEGGDIEYEWSYGDGSPTGTIPSHRYNAVGGYPVKLTVRDAASNREASTVRYVNIRKLGPPTEFEDIASQTTIPCTFPFGFRLCINERRGHMTFRWRTIPDPNGEIQVRIRIINSTGFTSNCWFPAKSELSSQVASAPYQTFRWNGPNNPRNGEDRANAFCATRTYHFEAQTVRTYQTSQGPVVEESLWGQPGLRVV